MFAEATEAKFIAKCDKSNAFMQHVLPQLAVNSIHSLMEFWVRTHLDVFRGKERDKFENKVLMTVKSKSNYNSEYALGRGGAGRGIYAYAIIDHPESSEMRREKRQRRRNFLNSYPHLANLRVNDGLMAHFFPGYNAERPGNDPGPPAIN